MSLAQMYASRDDFMASIDKGIAIIASQENEPHPDDKANMKALLAVFVTASIKMDEQAVNDPELDSKLTTARLALLAAYNLGRQNPQKEMNLPVNADSVLAGSDPAKNGWQF